MLILILYQLLSRKDRGTIQEHLYSFKNYDNGNTYCYVNVEKSIPIYLNWINFDAVIFHYTFLGGQRFIDEEKPWNNLIRNAKLLKGYKIAIPQDEYDHTDRLNKFFRETGINSVYTCFTNQADIDYAYPYYKSGVKFFFQVFTGYIDEIRNEKLALNALSYKNRPIDIGYRARKLPAYFGRHGQLKYELVDLFIRATESKDFVTDIKNTQENSKKTKDKFTKLGNDWFDFLFTCKAIIGCEGGASLLDANGSIKNKVNAFEKLNPEADFDEIEKACFPEQDFNISCFALSPRHFEAVMTQTLQILVEGTYGNIFKPWIHYIPLKRDFSNLDEILATLKNPEKCQEIINNAYKDILLSRKYTYSSFVKDILNDIKSSVKTKDNNQNVFFNYVLISITNFRNNLLLLYISFKNKLYPIFKTLFFKMQNQVL
jgi:hypothetical protein